MIYSAKCFPARSFFEDGIAGGLGSQGLVGSSIRGVGGELGLFPALTGNTRQKPMLYSCLPSSPIWNPQSGCFCQGGAPHGDTVDIRAILNPPKPLFTCHHRARNSSEIPRASGRNFSCFKC